MTPGRKMFFDQSMLDIQWGSKGYLICQIVQNNDLPKHDFSLFLKSSVKCSCKLLHTTNWTFTRKTIQVFTLRKERNRLLLLTVYLEIYPLHVNSLLQFRVFDIMNSHWFIKCHIYGKIDFATVAMLA